MNYQSFVSPNTRYHQFTEPFRLESGVVLEGVQVAYRTWGSLNDRGDNAILICHALTGWADADDWWQPLFGAGRVFDSQRDFIVCSNVLGSCYGTTGPTSPNPATGKPYGAEFPAVTVRDMVHLQARLLETLNVRHLKLVIGGSLGGMQVLEWALLYPERVGAIAPIAVSGRHSAWCIGLSEAQRQAIFADPNWQGGNYSPSHPPTQGLAVARMIAMTTYRAWESFELRFSRQVQADDPNQPFAISHYLQYQGQKLVERFDANTYVTLTYAMDSHDVGYNRGSFNTALNSIRQPALVVAIDTDVLYPPIEQQKLAEQIPASELAWLRSPHGHDAFLIDMEELNQMLVSFFSHPPNAVPSTQEALNGDAFRKGRSIRAISG